MPNITHHFFHAIMNLGVISSVLCLAVGCGTTQQRTATEQLVVSDAVDKSIDQIDFRSLAGQKVFFDTSYIRPIKADGFVSADYVISALRQQMIAAHCLMQDVREEADIVVEARIGTLSTNRHEIVYGIPKSTAPSLAVAAITNHPLLPAIPELAVARSDSTLGVSKLAVYAYDRESKEPIWQSGTSRSESSAKSTWVLGAGPFQKGSIHKGYRFAGERLSTKNDGEASNPSIQFASEHLFSKPQHGPGLNRTAENAAESINLNDSPAKR
jgi:hypothetical protein